jgi:hypothetical protein
MHIVEQYRKNARDCRELAKRVDQSDGDRQTLERLAKAWERLANLRERDIKLEL